MKIQDKQSSKYGKMKTIKNQLISSIENMIMEKSKKMVMKKSGLKNMHPLTFVVRSKKLRKNKKFKTNPKSNYSENSKSIKSTNLKKNEVIEPKKSSKTKLNYEDQFNTIDVRSNKQ
jgi:hypothetical protein